MFDVVSELDWYKAWSPVWWRASADEVGFYWGNRTVQHVPKRTKGLTAWLKGLTLVSPWWAWMCWITWSFRLTGHNHRQGPLILHKQQKHLEMINMKLTDYFSLESLANLSQSSTIKQYAKRCGTTLQWFHCNLRGVLGTWTYYNNNMIQGCDADEML